MRATATKTGALPRPATQCTATHASGVSRNRFFSNSNHSSTTWKFRIRTETFTFSSLSLICSVSERYARKLLLYLVRWKCAVIEHQIYHIDPFRFKFLDFIRWFADSYHLLHIMLFQFLLRGKKQYMHVVLDYERKLLIRMTQNMIQHDVLRILTWIKVWMVWSLGRSVMRNFMFLYSISAGAGLISFTLMLLISSSTASGNVYTSSPFYCFSFLFLFKRLKDLRTWLLESRTCATLYEATKAGFDNLAH